MDLNVLYNRLNIINARENNLNPSSSSLSFAWSCRPSRGTVCVSLGFPSGAETFWTSRKTSQASSALWIPRPPKDRTAQWQKCPCPFILVQQAEPRLICNPRVGCAVELCPSVPAVTSPSLAVWLFTSRATGGRCWLRCGTSRERRGGRERPAERRGHRAHGAYPATFAWSPTFSAFSPPLTPIAVVNSQTVELKSPLQILRRVSQPAVLPPLLQGQGRPRRPPGFPTAHLPPATSGRMPRRGAAARKEVTGQCRPC